MMFSTCAPFMAFSYALDGIDMPTIVLVLFVDFLAVLASTQAAISLAANLPGNHLGRACLVVSGVVWLGVVLVIAQATTAEMIYVGIDRMGAGGVGAFIVIVMVTLIWIAMLFFTSVMGIQTIGSLKIPTLFTLIGMWFGCFIVALFWGGATRVMSFE
jgi:hypothetical protein